MLASLTRCSTARPWNGGNNLKTFSFHMWKGQWMNHKGSTWGVHFHSFIKAMLCPEAMPQVEQKGQQSWEGSLADGTVDSSSRHAFTSSKIGGVSRRNRDSQQTGMVGHWKGRCPDKVAFLFQTLFTYQMLRVLIWVLPWTEGLCPPN